MEFTQLFGIAIDGLVAIIVAMLGYRQATKEKNDRKYRELREQLEKEREDRALKEKKAQEVRLDSIESNVKTITEDLDNLNTCVKSFLEDQLGDITKQLNNLHTMESNNFSYIHSLSNVVVNIGETLNDSKLLEGKPKDKLETCIEEHKKTEMDIHNQLCKLIM